MKKYITEFDIEWSFKLFLWGWVDGGWMVRWWIFKMKFKLLKPSTKLKLKLRLKFDK